MVTGLAIASAMGPPLSDSYATMTRDKALKVLAGVRGEQGSMLTTFFLFLVVLRCFVTATNSSCASGPEAGIN
jgi:hypothetical protein